MAPTRLQESLVLRGRCNSTVSNLEVELAIRDTHPQATWARRRCFPPPLGLAEFRRGC